MRLDQLRRKTKGIGKLKLRDERKSVRNKRQESGRTVRANADSQYENDVECHDDDKESEETSRQKREVQDRVITKELQQISIPKGVLCSECAKIGVYDMNSNDEKRNIKRNEEGRANDSREKCSICQTLGTTATLGDNMDAVRMSVLYSHDFYDKYSRDKRPGPTTDSGEDSSVKNENSRQEQDKNDNRVNREKSIDRNEPPKTSKRPIVNSVRIPVAQQEVDESKTSPKDHEIKLKEKENATGNPTVDGSQTNEKCNNETGKKEKHRNSGSGTSLPELVSKISIVDAKDTKPTQKTNHDRKRQLSGDRSFEQSESLYSDDRVSKKVHHPKPLDTPRSFILAATRRNADRFSSMYMKRAMKGSTVRREMLNRCGETEHYPHQG